MQNRFLETDAYLRRRSRGQGRDRATAFSGGWAQPFSASDRRLVILIENGGVDLGIPTLVDKLLSFLPAGLISDAQRQALVVFLRDKLKSFTDNLLETAELAINRYSAAKPQSFGDVIVLRDGTASYQDLKSTLIALAREGKIVDLLILTHGGTDYVSVRGGVDGQKIRSIRAELGKPLTLRSVYMMNCVGSSLNQAWIDAGAKVSAGSRNNNYLPEPTLYFFWKNWVAGQPFESAATSAYRRTINLMNGAVRAFINSLPIPGTSLLAESIDFTSFDFVKDSAPVIQGQGSVTINTDDLSFTQTISSGLATTVVPVDTLRAFTAAEPARGAAGLSEGGLAFLRRWEQSQHGGGFAEAETRALVDRAGQALQVLEECVRVPLDQNQSDALVSFVYNIGAKGFRQSTLLRLLNQGDLAGTVAELKKWTKARRNGALVDLPDLIERRAAEAELFLRSAGSLRQPIGVEQSIAWHESMNVPVTDIDRQIMYMTQAQLLQYLRQLDKYQREDMLRGSTGWFQKRVQANFNDFKLEHEPRAVKPGVTGSTNDPKPSQPDSEQTPAKKATQQAGVGEGVFAAVPNPFHPNLPYMSTPGLPRGYAYTVKFPVGKVSEYVNARTAMRILKNDPNKIFPFGVEPKAGTGPAAISNNAELNLVNARSFFMVGKDAITTGKDPVRVEDATDTQFTFRTLNGHFDGPNALISFRTYEKDGQVYLEQSAFAPNAGEDNAAFAPGGAKKIAWPQQAENLRKELEQLDPLGKLRPSMP